eukprot:TRINITY_DN1235_c0_g1_i2.p1 TRINITY_DN1235_c0_g1~~TRINITY_DN1235_c0_g1_i2.p1  ORF type:complete len:372 (+),score=141.08 TRINITY_DN1235_c0_g1_i2:214-1329(+)
MCIAGTPEQLSRSAQKDDIAAYDADTWKFFVRLRGTIFLSTWRHALAALVIAFFITLSHQLGGEWCTMHDKGHQLTIFPIGFLLVFRANLSYGRWWDGRCAIGELVFSSRCIAVKTLTYICADSPPDLAQKHCDAVLRLVLAFIVNVRHSVQRRGSGEAELSQEKRQVFNQLRVWELEHYLADDSVAEMRAGGAAARAVILCNMLCRKVLEPAENEPHDIDTVRYRWPTAVGEIVQHVENLLAAWQRILKIATTPMPFPYAHCLELFLYMWVYTLPFSVLGVSMDMGWLAVPTTMASAVLLFGTNHVGQMIEDPFGNDPTDFDLVRFQRMLHNEMVALVGRPERLWLDAYKDDGAALGDLPPDGENHPLLK